MNLDNLILKLQEKQKMGFGKYIVSYDFGACDVESVIIDKEVDGTIYIRLDDVELTKKEIDEIENPIIKNSK